MNREGSCAPFLLCLPHAESATTLSQGYVFVHFNVFTIHNNEWTGPTVLDSFFLCTLKLELPQLAAEV